jgi:glycerophosphoryl diester phosphodiesterase
MPLRSLDWSRRRVLGGFGAALAPVVGLGGVKYFASASPPSRRPTIIGHRGAAGLAAPNTIASIHRALEYDVDGVELDVRQTNDGELILYHDPVLNWDSTGEGWIENITLEEVREARIEGEPIPTLSEALETLQEYDPQPELYLELKSTGYTEDVLETIDRYDARDRLTVASFSEEVLASVAETDIPTGYIGDVARPGVVESALEAETEIVMCHYTPFMTHWFTEQAREAKLNPGVWKLGDTERTIRKTLSADPDLVVTNRPDLVLEQLESM